ncbi:MAG: methionine adenosyltransferase [Candidatus Aenigmatarchaeota archaeon]
MMAMKNIIAEQLQQIPIAKQKIEIVERKGIGHPDTICDSIMNEISIELCKMYMEKVGAILHHNIDKAMLTAGEVEVKFGGGSVKKPMLLVIGDRATFRSGDIEFPVNELSITTTKKMV